MPHFFCTFCPIPQRQHTINRIIQSILMVPCKHGNTVEIEIAHPKRACNTIARGEGLPASVSQALLERCRVQKAGNLCGSFIPVATFDAAGWFEQFFSSLVRSPAAWLRQGSSAPRRGTGTSARPKSKKGNLFRRPFLLLIVCRSSYKCGVFFKDLSPKVPLAWLGALPEAVVRAAEKCLRNMNL